MYFAIQKHANKSDIFRMSVMWKMRKSSATGKIMKIFSLRKSNYPTRRNRWDVSYGHWESQNPAINEYESDVLDGAKFLKIF